MKKRTFISLILAALLAIASVFPVSAFALTNDNKEVLTEYNMKLKAEQEDETRVQQILRSTYLCDYCYGTATATCNGERTKGDTRYHGKNCGYTTYYSTVRVKCDFCSRSYTLQNSRHACLQTHTACGAGSVNVCPFR